MKIKSYPFLMIFCLLLTGGSMAQGLVSFQVQPSNPTVADTVKLEAELWFPSGPCWIDHQSIMIDSTDIRVDGCFNSGMLTVICNYSDVRTLGILAPGTYTALYTACYPFPVPNWYDTATVTFTVSTFTGQFPAESGEVFRIYPNPASDRLFLSFPGSMLPETILVEILDIAGRCCMVEKKDYPERLFSLQLQLPRGQYFIRLSHAGSVIGHQPLIIL